MEWCLPYFLAAHRRQTAYVFAQYCICFYSLVYAFRLAARMVHLEILVLREIYGAPAGSSLANPVRQ